LIELDKEELSKHVYYDEASPTCLRAVYKTSKREAGDVAGSIYNGKDGRKSAYIKILGTTYKVSRIIWTINNGSIDNDKFVHHLDGNQLNLKISNLHLLDSKSSIRHYDGAIEKSKSIAKDLSTTNIAVNDYRFYVYAHTDADGVIRYIGKGSGKRAFSKNGRGSKWSELFTSFSPYNVKILAENLTEDEALSLEHLLIIKNKDNLVNFIHKSGKTKEIKFDDINKFVYYDTNSPTFLRWKIDCNWNGVYLKSKKDSVAGTISKTNGYANVTINKEIYKIHRIVWVLFNKHISSNLVIDHIDRNRSNNSIENLRLVDNQINVRNRLLTNNTTGERNIVGNDGTFVVSYTFDGKRISTNFSKARFGTEDLALEAAIEYRDYLVNLGLII
jgi:hypothetical protein